MVLKDIFNSSILSPGNSLNERRRFKAWRIPLADPLSRWAALVVDLFVILAPTISLFLSSVKKQVLISEWLGKGLDFQVYILMYLIFAMMIVVLYQGLFTAFFGGTPGKLFFGLRVVSIWNEEKPGMGASLLRAVYWCVGALGFFLPHLAIFYHRERRPIYDRLADTVVIAQEKFAVGPPAMGLGGLLRLTLSLLYVAIFIMISHSLYSIFEENRKYQTSSLFWQTDESDTCRSVSRYFHQKNHRGPKIRMERALSLFAIEKIDDECLDREADNVLWNFEEITPAYAAKALLFMDEKSVFTKYLAKTCQGKSDPDYCLLLHALYSEVQDKTRNDLDRIYFNLSRSSHDDIKIWSLKHWLRTHDYVQALNVIDTIKGDGEIAAYIAESRAKALWSTNQFNNARIALYTFLPTAPLEDRLYTNSWFCYHESLQGCSAKQERSCNAFMDDLANFQVSNLDPEILIPAIRRAECEKGNKVNYSDFLKAAKTSTLRDFLGALLVKSTQSESSRSLLTDILTKSTDPILKSEASLRLLELPNSQKSEEFVFKEWKNKKANYGDHWIIVGQKVFDNSFVNRRYNQAFETGQLLSRVIDSNSFLEKYIISAHRSGHSKQAWEIVASQNTEKNIRSPAALEKKELDEIKDELRKKFGK
ncbi:MAG: hypothetical protein A4S09_12365 [Proteobacteria bacterium SG_bin7]|nr:MAG: hypothetical protein A4S09_12365 [Proteobacteria bacterium SG_bin7]